VSEWVHMNRIILETQLGTAAMSWNPGGLLKKISFREYGEALPVSAGQMGLKRESFTREIPKNIILLVEKMRAYFELGEPIQGVSWVGIDQEEWTDFQKRVYQMTSQIPHGDTRSYAWVASKIGKPLASRAVGQALKRNPVPVLVPCHRVVSSQGGLGGFMGKMHPDDPELKLKERLLLLENSYVNPEFPFQKHSA